MDIITKGILHTNGANDRCAAVVLLGLKLGVQARKPFDSSASTRQMLERVSHCKRISSLRDAFRYTAGSDFSVPVAKVGDIADFFRVLKNPGNTGRFSGTIDDVKLAQTNRLAR